jgi:DNA-binding NarL/FixJ family response regulator
LSKTRVLLADDYRPLLESVSGLLGSGFEIVGEAQNGQALVEAALKLKPDVIGTDISMPILTGVEAAKRLREAGSTSKIVFLTVISDPNFILTCMATGGAWLRRKRSAGHRSGACHPRGRCGANLHFTGSQE